MNYFSEVPLWYWLLTGSIIVFICLLRPIIQWHVIATSHKLLRTKEVKYSEDYKYPCLICKDNKYALMIILNRVILYKYHTKVNRCNILSQKQKNKLMNKIKGVFNGKDKKS